MSCDGLYNPEEYEGDVIYVFPAMPIRFCMVDACMGLDGFVMPDTPCARWFKWADPRVCAAGLMMFVSVRILLASASAPVRYSEYCVFSAARRPISRPSSWSDCSVRFLGEDGEYNSLCEGDVNEAAAGEDGE